MANPEGQLIEQAAHFALEHWEIVTASLVIAALTFKQRQYILKRDDNKCQADFINHIHRGGLQVNHTPPQSWSIEHGLDPDSHPDVSKLTMCEEAHNIYHRGDIKKAKRQFHEGNQDAFKEMSKRHQLLSKNDEIFWEDQHDIHIQTRHRQNEEKAKRKGLSWPFKREGKEEGGEHGE